MSKKKWIKNVTVGTAASLLGGCAVQHSVSQPPNILIILADDMGFSDIGCYGGEVDTPALNQLAENGIRMTQFYNTARCCPSRASLLTGLYPHQTDIGHFTFNDGVEGYFGDLNRRCVTLAEGLKGAGYGTYMSGKWHLTRYTHAQEMEEKHSWPCQRGFDEFYGTIIGACGYYNPVTLTRNNESIETPEGTHYLTDSISEEAVRQIREHHRQTPDRPFFQYVAYTAPHWPLHAPSEDVEKYKGRFDQGWNKLREERMDRLVEMGIIHSDWKLTPRDPSQPEWEKAEHKEWEARRMEVYAAQIDRMDQGIGKIIDSLEKTGRLDNTLIIFLSDNGGSSEGLRPENLKWMKECYRARTRDGRDVHFGNVPSVMPGGEDTYQSYGKPWANVSNTPFRGYKVWTHEGGIATPLIVHWPAKIKDGGTLRHTPAQLPDIMATCLSAAGVEYPDTYQGHEITPLEGHSMLPLFAGGEFKREVLYWEHQGNRAVRKGRWKLVNKHPGSWENKPPPGDWELYDIEKDRTELNDLSQQYPEVVKELSVLWQKWADRCHVKPWQEIVDGRKKRREQN